MLPLNMMHSIPCFMLCYLCIESYSLTPRNIFFTIPKLSSFFAFDYRVYSQKGTGLTAYKCKTRFQMNNFSKKKLSYWNDRGPEMA